MVAQAWLILIMMGKRITKITAQKRNPNRVNIFLDGEFAFSLDRLNAAWLTKGRQLSESEIEQLLTKEEFTCPGQSPALLGYRARSHQMECLAGKRLSGRLDSHSSPTLGG